MIFFYFPHDLTLTLIMNAMRTEVIKSSLFGWSENNDEKKTRCVLTDKNETCDNFQTPNWIYLAVLRQGSSTKKDNNT